MNITPTSAIPNQNGGSQTKSTNQLNLETFLVLLSVQMSTQNPLEPMSDRDFFAQLAQLGTVQGMDGLQSAMKSAESAGLIGKKVTALRPYNETGSNTNEVVTGTVQKVSIRDGIHWLSLKQADGGIVEVKVENIRSIEAAG
jgi:flagellar basal-body rod modification protein FlgD